MHKFIYQILHTQTFNLLSSIIGFGTVLLIIKSLTVQEYGSYIVIQAFLAFAGLIFSQNLYCYSRLKIPGSDLRTQYGYLKTVITIVLFCYFLFVLLIFVAHASEVFFNFFSINPAYKFFVLTILFFELVNLEFQRFYIAISRITKKNIGVFIQRIFLFLGVSALMKLNLLSFINFLFLFFFSQALSLIYLLFSLNITQLINSKMMRDVITVGYSFAIPLLPIGFLSVGINYTDTIMISKLVDIETVAQYGFASQIVIIAMTLIGGSIVLTLFSYATEAHNKFNYELRSKYFSIMLKLGIIASLAFYLLAIINIDIAISFLELNEYNDVSKYIVVLGLMPLLHLLYNTHSHHIQLLGYIKIQIYLAIFILVLNITLNYFLINYIGAIGAAYASLASFVILYILFLIKSLHIDKIFRLEIKSSFNRHDTIFYLSIFLFWTIFILDLVLLNIFVLNASLITIFLIYIKYYLKEFNNLHKIKY